MNGDFSSKLDELLANPAMMAQIKALADTMTSGAEPSAPAPQSTAKPESESQPTPEQASVPADAPVLPAMLTPPPALERNLKNTRALLTALKPYLDDKRREKIDKMLNMMRLAEMAGYFKNLI